MKASSLSPYPTHAEILRFIVVALDLQTDDKKKLDDLAHVKIFDPRVLSSSIQERILPRVEKYMGPEIANSFSGWLFQFLEEYTQVVANISADGVSRSQMLVFLSRGVIYKHVVNAVLDLHKKFGGPDPVVFFVEGKSSVSSVLEWIRMRETRWIDYLQGLEKDRRDRIGAWSRGQDIPSAQQIFGLNNDSKVEINWPRVRGMLFFARALDHAAKFDAGETLLATVRNAVAGKSKFFDMGAEIKEIQDGCYLNFSSLLPLIAEVSEGMLRTIEKEGASGWLKKLEDLQTSLNNDPFGRMVAYLADWYLARWNVFSGNIIAAVDLYKSAFEGVMYKSGLNQKFLIEEALVVAASLENPDKVFLKHLKWAQLTLDYEIASVTSTTPSREFSDTVEDWEVDIWRGNLKKVFPERGLFPGVSLETNSSIAGPIWVGDFAKIKPDFGRPDRRVKIGEKGGRQKRLRQLVWFAGIGDFDACKKLLEKGANVNLASDAGDTAILMALEAINVTEPGRSQDRKLFDLIAGQKHKAETLNTRTSKKRLLPVISAVQSGRVDVVERVLALGADPNGRGMTDEQTPLTVCLKLIDTFKNPEKVRQSWEKMPVTPEVLDSIRRHSAGVSGYTLEDQYSLLIKNENNPIFRTFMAAYWKVRFDSILKNTDLNSMRDIARLLIHAGADADAENASPILGYTPLMLAAELDERTLFELMLTKGGNPAKTYVCPNSGRKISCWEIADYFESIEVGKVLADIRRYFPLH